MFMKCKQLEFFYPTNYLILNPNLAKGQDNEKDRGNMKKKIL